MININGIKREVANTGAVTPFRTERAIRRAVIPLLHDIITDMEAVVKADGPLADIEAVFNRYVEGLNVDFYSLIKNGVHPLTLSLPIEVERAIEAAAFGGVPPSLASSFGALLNEIGVKGTELSTLLGYSPSYVSLIVTGAKPWNGLTPSQLNAVRAELERRKILIDEALEMSHLKELQLPQEHKHKGVRDDKGN